jgi:hypothetical protein
MTTRGDLRTLLRDLNRAGAHTVKGRGHWKVYLGNRLITTIAGTPRCPHAYANARKQLRAAGLEV